eukprot:1147371-Pelagomonas_calceolata.AAC.2
MELGPSDGNHMSAKRNPKLKIRLGALIDLEHLQNYQNFKFYIAVDQPWLRCDCCEREAYAKYALAPATGATASVLEGLYGESVGDLDVVDGAVRSVTCIALDEGCLLVQVRRTSLAVWCCFCDLALVQGEIMIKNHAVPWIGLSVSQVPRGLFLSFVHSHPRALLLYLQQGLARLWRVAHFTLSDFLQ